MTQPSMRIADFINTIGVNTHILYADGGYGNIDNVASYLQYLGVSNVRDIMVGWVPTSEFALLAQKGIKFTFLLVGGGSQTTANLQSQLGLVSQLLYAAPGSVAAVEGTNETNNWPVTYNGVTGLDGALNLQKDMYAAIKANPAFHGIAVDYFTGYAAGSIGVGPNPATTPGLADFNNQHPYPNGGQAPFLAINPQQAFPNASGAIGRAVYTETGYSTNGGASGVNANVQGKYILALLLDAAKYGIAKTFIYELMDAYQPGSPQGDSGFGLFDPNGQPKPSAIGIHNLTTILADSGVNANSFAPASVNYSIANLPTTGNSMALQKSDGNVFIVVWNEPQIWDAATGTELTAATANVTIDLGEMYQAVEVLDPLIGSAAIKTLSNVSSVILSLTDHPLLVELVSQTGSTPIPAPTPAATSTSNGLVLNISEYYYLADAQYTISVDGQQIGGVMTASALRDEGQTQSIVVNTALAPGTHVITVDFLNDGYGGSPSLDRNLYVDTATLNGQTIAGSTLALDSQGPQSFDVIVPGTMTTAPAFTPTPAATSTSNGLVLNISEYYYLADAQYTISVDGQQIGGVMTASALRDEGQTQSIVVNTALAPGTHVITVDFLNDGYGGSPSLDRNLYVDTATLNGQTIAGSTLALDSQGPQSFDVIVPTSSTTPTSTPATAQSLVLNISEDYYLANAQYTVAVDGQQSGGIMTASALHDEGQTQAVSFSPTLPAGSYAVTIAFLNDAYGGSPSLDRNLYLDSATLNGATIPGSIITMDSQGGYTFNLAVPST